VVVYNEGLKKMHKLSKIKKEPLLVLEEKKIAKKTALASFRFLIDPNSKP